MAFLPYFEPTEACIFGEVTILVKNQKIGDVVDYYDN